MKWSDVKRKRQRPVLNFVGLLKISEIIVEIREWISKYFYLILCDVIAPLYLNFNGSLDLRWS